jgi:trehalose utilization protein
MDMKALLLAVTVSLFPWAAFATPVRVLVWDERQPEQKTAYAPHFLGETLTLHLQKQQGITASDAHLQAPDQGLADAVLDETDVLIWWAHRRHAELREDRVNAVVRRVLDGRLSLIVLHSAHFAKPFMQLMDERARADAPGMIPADKRSGARMDFTTPHRRGSAGAGDPRSPAVEEIDGVWRLVLPACVFPAWRADAAPSTMSAVLPDHPVARGVPAEFVIPQTEMYAEPFHVPEPDEVIFKESWAGGEWFRSACAWKIGKGRVFYFRPGHETYPVFKQEAPQRILVNAVLWLGSRETPQGP